MNINEQLEKNETGISLAQILFLIKKNFLTILIITLLFTLIGAFYGLKIKKTVYTATATIMVMDDNASASTTTSANYQGYLFASFLVNSFNDFITSDAVIEAVKNNQNVTDNGIKGNVNIATKTDSLIVQVSYSSYDPDQALLIANELVEQSINVANTQYVDGKGISKYKYPVLANKLVELTLPTSDNVVSKRGASIIIIVAFILGIIVSLGIILVKYLADNTYTSKQDFEDTFGVNIMASIPTVKTFRGE